MRKVCGAQAGRAMRGLAAVAAALLVLPAVTAQGVRADEVTVSRNDLRTGWDQDEPALSPSAVRSGRFGQLFSTAVNGQVYAQPLVVGSTVIVATENDRVYGLNSVTGAVASYRATESPRPPGPGTSPPGDLAESVVRLAVRPGGSLAAQDFFSPENAPALDSRDIDFGSGGPVGLPFGTQKYPHLMVAIGKYGTLYLLNRDNLGGREQGPDGTDAALRAICCFAGEWGHPGTVTCSASA